MRYFQAFYWSLLFLLFLLFPTFFFWSLLCPTFFWNGPIIPTFSFWNEKKRNRRYLKWYFSCIFSCNWWVVQVCMCVSFWCPSLKDSWCLGKTFSNILAMRYLSFKHGLGSHGQGKVRGKWIFIKVREFWNWSMKFEKEAKVREKVRVFCKRILVKQ